MTAWAVAGSPGDWKTGWGQAAQWTRLDTVCTVLYCTIQYLVFNVLYTVQYSTACIQYCPRPVYSTVLCGGPGDSRALDTVVVRRPGGTLGDTAAGGRHCLVWTLVLWGGHCLGRTLLNVDSNAGGGHYVVKCC